MKSTIRLTFCAAAVALSLGGCDKLKGGLGKDKEPATSATASTTSAPPASAESTASADKPADKPADTAPADTKAATPPSTPSSDKADNEREVKRYKDEKEISDRPTAKIESPWVGVREEARYGAEHVATLKKGKEVTKLAEKSGFTLVIFDSDTDAGKKLMGWLVSSAFIPDKDAGVPKIKLLNCPAGQAAIADDQQDYCAIVCTRDEQCPSTMACHAEGILRTSMVPVKMCKTGSRTPPPVVADAGAPKDAGGTVDAATRAPKLAPGNVIRYEQADAAPCRAGYFKSGTLCRWQCELDIDCGTTGAKCADSGTAGVKVCK